MPFRLCDENEEISPYNYGLQFSDKKKEQVVKSWAGFFSDEIFPAIDETVFESLFQSEPSSRPDCPVKVLAGALILKDTMDLTDEEVIYRTNFDYLVRYALHITNWEDVPFSMETLVRFRKSCSDYAEKTGVDLFQKCIEPLSEKLTVLRKKCGRKRRRNPQMW